VEPLRIGLLSTAAINRRIVDAARASDAAQVVAVSSRTEGRAQAYAREHGIPAAHGSYEALLADPDVEAVYIALPNALHVEWTERALTAGKHVLVEKPFATRAEDAARCFALAEQRGLVLTEAFMWRHHPQARRLAALVADDAIGPLRLVRASFSFTLDRPDDPRWDPALGGGALLDVGTYGVSGARLLAGEPASVTSSVVRAPGGVDTRWVATLAFPGDVLAIVDCAIDLPYAARLEAVGATGIITLTDPWSGRRPEVLLTRDDRTEPVPVEPADPYRLEVEDLARAVRTGAAPLLGRADAVGQARALELLLAAAG
jgi:predicted dehydrogenase